MSQCWCQGLSHVLPNGCSGLKLPTALTRPGGEEPVSLDVFRTDDGKVHATSIE